MIKISLFFLIPVLCFSQILTQIDNQILHLKGDVGVTITGSGVSEWADQGGGGNDFPQANDANRPDGSSGTYIDFDGVNEYLGGVDNDNFDFGDGSSDTPLSMIVYVKMDDATAFRFMGKGQQFIFTTAASDGLALVLYDDTNNNYIRNISTDALTAYQNQWITACCIYDGSGSSSGIDLFVNNVLQTEGLASNNYTAMNEEVTALDIGRLQAAGDYADGSIQQFIVTNDVLTSTERANIQTYFETGVYPTGRNINEFPGHSEWPDLE